MVGSVIDKSAISDITPQGYSIHHVSRHGRKEGSVALVYNSNIEVKSIRNKDKWSNFELLKKSALRDCMKSATASVLFFTDLQFKVNRVMSLSSGMAFDRTPGSTLHHFGHNPRHLVQLTSDNTRSVPDSDRSSGTLINIITSLIRQRTTNAFHQKSANHQNLAKIPKAIPEDKLITS
jgi:hypothetical protein